MFPFYHNSCWVLGKSFANCENLTAIVLNIEILINSLQIPSKLYILLPLSSRRGGEGEAFSFVFIWLVN